ncbi:MAG: anion permease [Rothia mucilaginosa]|uniref:inorganic phosphate transporter n=1 Tax=unclassified Rothia (in: high G+C Gram-positive bacteria) TaxID=2689056 RepID=UPI0008A1C960|nr:MULTISPECIES: inorganic phosphate transporter [unclassified Rothia (in: high G+C Gram-positive bacteria)]MBS4946178.1 inorganic phosphate transporter [Rothia mucilaginosa]MBF1675669.1 inorganic phosphate transporter [Rothia sp. (in: high G+C Gram-positive bacteria)]MDU6367177.1 anion permease [Rothia mucilaginosa]OFQ28508.1 inorganic phosphate transporter [Rothia sp. HMSC072E10]OHP73201.1 inorganic phosphate transporter [Rothia sp. HMSC062F03]
MTTELIILVIVVLTALAFDFTNGFHDTGNAMATSIATGALKPKTAVALSASLNLVGAFLSVEVARSVGSGIVNLDRIDVTSDGPALMLIVFTGLVGGILWNVLTWLLGLPSSSSHALFGGLIGSALVAIGFDGVQWMGVLSKIIVPAVLSPVIAAIVSATGTWLVYRIAAPVADERKHSGFRKGQVATASLMSLAHGTNDAQKTMGVIFLALVASGSLNSDDAIPLWVKAACALAIALGTYLGGWRIIRTLGKGIVEVDTPQGVAADGASAAIILTSSHFGMALSTTHVASGSILGSGLGRKGAEVRWSVAGRMVVAWLITLPAAAIVGALTWLIGHGLNALTGTQFIGEMTVFALLVIFCFLMWRHSQKDNIDASNVTGDWDEKEGAAVTSAEASADQTLATEKAGS